LCTQTSDAIWQAIVLKLTTLATLSGGSKNQMNICEYINCKFTLIYSWLCWYNDDITYKSQTFNQSEMWNFTCILYHISTGYAFLQEFYHTCLPRWVSNEYLPKFQEFKTRFLTEMYCMYLSKWVLGKYPLGIELLDIAKISV
jgi:hypothetical protein